MDIMCGSGFIVGTRAYSGSEFVVANTLAKWKKLEPNEINLSQKVVLTNCFVITLYQLGVTFVAC